MGKASLTVLRPDVHFYNQDKGIHLSEEWLWRGPVESGGEAHAHITHTLRSL